MPTKRRAGKRFAVNVTVRVRPALTREERGRVEAAAASVATGNHGSRRSVHARAGDGVPVCLLGGEDVWEAGNVAVAGVATGVKVFSCFSSVVGPQRSQADAQDVLMPGFVDSFLDGCVARAGERALGRGRSAARGVCARCACVYARRVCRCTHTACCRRKRASAQSHAPTCAAPH